MSSPLLLRHPSDHRSVFVVFLTLAMLTTPVVLGSRLPAVSAALFVPVVGTFCLSAGAIAHNLAHLPIFRSRRLDVLFAALTSLAMGHAATGILLSHNHNHHIHVGSDRDWFSPRIAGSGPNRLRLVRFILRANGSVERGLEARGAPRLPRAKRRRILAEQGILYTTAASLALAAPRAFFLFILPSWVFGLLAFLIIIFLQHDGCVPGSELRHSRNYVGRTINWFFFNGGYHAAHHIRPGLHWSALPRFHGEHVAPRADPRLTQRSLLGHLLREYVIGGGTDTGAL